jgi:hypothetical protein
VEDIKEFFDTNPLAPEVIEVEGQLFLSNHRGAAEECAKRIGAKLVVHPNPSLKKSKEAGDDGGDAKGNVKTDGAEATKGKGKGKSETKPEGDGGAAAKGEGKGKPEGEGANGGKE